MTDFIIPNIELIPKPPSLEGRAVLRTAHSVEDRSRAVSHGVDWCRLTAASWRRAATDPATQAKVNQTAAQCLARAAWWDSAADEAERGEDQ